MWSLRFAPHRVTSTLLDCATITDISFSYLYSTQKSAFPLPKSRSIPGSSSIASKAKERPSEAQVQKRQSWLYQRPSKQSTGLHWMINFRVPFSKCNWRQDFPFTISWRGYLGFCITLGVEGISDGGERAQQRQYMSYNICLFKKALITFHL